MADVKIQGVSGGEKTTPVDSDTFEIQETANGTSYWATLATILKKSDVDDTPVDAATEAPISSNWAFDHETNHADAFQYIEEKETSRSLGTSADATVELGNFTVANGSVVILVNIACASGGFAQSASYAISANYHATAGTWQIVKPVSNSGAYGGNEFELLVNGTNAVNSLKLRRVSGATAGDLNFISVKTVSNSSGTWTFTSVTGTESQPSVVYAGSYSDIDDTAVNGEISNAISSNWAFDHAATHAPSDADNTTTNETSHATVVEDADFASDGILIRSGGAGSYSVDTSTYITSAGVTYENLNTNGDVGTGAAQVAVGNHTHTNPTGCLVIAASDEGTDLTTGDGKVTFRMPYGYTLTDIRASVTTAPTGAGITVDVTEGGTSILSTLITIDVSTKSSEAAAAQPVISDAALADDAEIQINIDVIGSTVAGTGLKVYLIGRLT